MTDSTQVSDNMFGKASLTNRGNTILINQDGKQLLLDTAPAEEQIAPGVLPSDRSWLHQSFITSQDSTIGTQRAQLADQDRRNRSFSTASLKYTDTSPGGNKCINPPAGFTRYADIRHARAAGDTQEVTVKAPNNNSSLGMGRYYSEAIDDNSQVIHMRFGVASFNSLTQFFTGFYSGELAANARAASFTDDWITKWSVRFGNVVGLAVAPMFIIPMAVILIGSVARYMLNKPSSKFYTLKPAMPMYWTAVNNIVNQLAVNSGLSSYINTNASKVVLKGGFGADELKTSTVMNMVGAFLPDGLIQPNGTIDVFAIANRANRAEIQYQEAMANAFKKADTNTDWFEVVRNHLKTNPVGNFTPGATTLEAYFQRFIDYTKSSNTKADSKSDAMVQDVRNGGYSKDGKSYDGTAALNAAGPGFLDFLNSQLNDGGEWVSYRVDYTGQVQESFANSTTESSLASKINGMSRSARETRFNLADGNVSGIVGDALNAVKGVVSGIAEIVHVEGLAAFAGSAFVDIPRMWNESTTSMPKSNYTITLISPAGNPISHLFNIWIPLATLLAGVMPLATGKQSHTSPYLCELHDQGRAMTRLGIIDSMSISRGTSNLGFNREGHALAIEVSFSVMDLSSIIAMPIKQGFDPLNPLEGLFDDENAFSDYLMTLSAMKLSDTIYRAPMLKYQINRKMADISSFFTASHIASRVAALPGVELLGAMMRGTDRN